MADQTEEKQVVLHTTMGDIVIRLYADMPVTAGNFEKLVNKGFYDKTPFHRVISKFMIQGGDPTGTGTGGPGYTIEDEFVKGRSNRRGTISMANTGRPNTGGSQFFINLVDNTFLDWDNPSTPSAHPVFGEVVRGMEVVDAIGKVKTNNADRPLKPVTIEKAELL
ncbi:peptidylprolyl isomerase [Methanoculleus sp. FWC-SCC1]|uniref:peptidylprolyl isomerase n=1 Tax=Methanoculleus frigidifontis TaxID=2584085 RepID=A0ABT8MAB5_9EURY|nr:peptidylprolyl isomerase [Methanoculleus sp. FWC-SCC1]MDN7024826.1 peptidylprolyl isomerase [Methanoculleus sp. FWC-SCC1]